LASASTVERNVRSSVAKLPGVRDREPRLARDPGEQLELPRPDRRLRHDRERREPLVERDEGDRMQGACGLVRRARR
jgi:hypothetical protein